MTNHEFLYDNICQSIVKWTTDFLEDMSTAGLAVNSSYVNWDAHADIHGLPAGDLIGSAGCGLVDNGDLFDVVFGVGISTDQDPDLYRLRQMMSRAYGRLRPGTKLVLYDHAASELAGQPVPLTWMVVQAPISVTPVSHSEFRPMQFLELQVQVDPRAPYAQ